MKKIITSALAVTFTVALLNAQATKPYTPEVYEVVKTKQPVKIDANWDKKQWKNVKPVTVTYYIREETDRPVFRPNVQAKMVYDKDNIYVIFRVEDKYVRCITDKINGPVWKDSAVEFFFAPDTEKPLHYFNLETNCGGTALMQFHVNVDGKRESKRLAEEEIRQVEIAHSLPSIIDPEITENITWTIEYCIPVALLQKHSPITAPAKGVEWKANFYKIAEINSNPHHIAWSRIDHPRPNFHIPEAFGKLIFK
ncbi:MAG: carbohydrate-binding family 9-like protein [Bacteroidales bacterium]|jgi:hypothetical protein|nr:carbohydrate-binding family 9-like protein [Bacteroidales bacterium]